MQCECVAFPCKEYIFMKDKVPWRWSKSTLRYIQRGAITCLTGQVRSEDLTPIEEVCNIMKKKSGNLPKIRKQT